MSATGVIAASLCSLCCFASALGIAGGAAYMLLKKKPPQPRTEPVVTLAKVEPIKPPDPVRPTITAQPSRSITNESPPPMPAPVAPAAPPMEFVPLQSMPSGAPTIIRSYPSDTGLPPDPPVPPKPLRATPIMMPTENVGRVPPSGPTILEPTPVEVSSADVVSPRHTMVPDERDLADLGLTDGVHDKLEEWDAADPTMIAPRKKKPTDAP